VTRGRIQARDPAQDLRDARRWARDLVTQLDDLKVLARALRRALKQAPLEAPKRPRRVR
jgi:hypothetical protein